MDDRRKSNALAQIAEQVCERMLQSSGRRVDLNSSFVDASLPEGSRLHVVSPDAYRQPQSADAAAALAVVTG